MTKNYMKIAVLCILFVGAGLASEPVSANARVAQARECLPNGAINRLVQNKQIASFGRIKRKLGLRKGSKIFNQRLCRVNGKLVYFFKVVDHDGRARALALKAVDGTPLPVKG